MLLKRGQTLCTVLGNFSGVVESASFMHIVKTQCRTISSLGDKFKVPARYPPSGESVWAEYIKLAALHKPAVNLGQGFPDYHPQDHVLQALCEVSIGDNPFDHQYTRGVGHERLVNNLSKLYSPMVCQFIDPMSEILVTFGAYESLYSAIMGHVKECDEVIVIEPFFDCYEYMIKCAGGIPKYIPLLPKHTSVDITSADWVLDEKELTSLFNKQTKMIILNTPHNPTGKVFTMEELTLIADLCKKYDVLCVSDEVYEWMVYEPKQHIKMATLPDMWERTLTTGSAGKTFSVTGWKTGWIYGPAALMRNLHIVHTNSIYVCATPIQEALARALEFELARRDSPDCIFRSLTSKEIVPKKDFIIQVLKQTGFIPIIPDAGYFILADWTPLAGKIDLSSEKDKYKDYRFTKKLTKESGVLTLPPSAFYSQEHKHLGENYARLCIIKKDENLQLASELLQKWSRK